MENYNPILLKEKERLIEIYKLRVKAWQSYGIITPQTYPNGYTDVLDTDGLHWVIQSENKVIGSARLNILFEPNSLPYPKTFKRVIDFDTDSPFIFYSRLVIDPEYQGNNYSALLDEARINFIKKQTGIKKIIATAGEKRAKKLKCYGFNILGKVILSDDYKSMDSMDTYIIQMKNE